MARGKGHLWERSWVPGCHQDSPAGWISFQRIDDVLELVNTLPFVVVMHSLVCCTKVPPLEAIDRAEIPLFSVSEALFVKELSSCISVPNTNFLITQILSVCVTFKEPNELLCYTPPEHVFGGQHRETLTKVIAHLTSEFR